MLKILIVGLLLTSLAYAKKDISPNEVYYEVRVLQEKVHDIHRFFKTDHFHQDESEDKVQLKVLPRNNWHKTYEIITKINLLRKSAGLPILEPSNIEPLNDLKPFFVYAQVKRLQTEIDIYCLKMGIEGKKVYIPKATNKTPIDIYNALNHVSISLDELNKKRFTYSYSFGQLMRVYEDLSKILDHLNIIDRTIPPKRDDSVKASDNFDKTLLILNKIAVIQKAMGIENVDFLNLKKNRITSSDVFSMTQMIISELQPIKAQLGLNNFITPPAKKYFDKNSVDVDMLMGWIQRRLIKIEEHIQKGGALK